MPLFGIVFAALVLPASATLWMPAHFGSGMVIQTWNSYHKSANLYGTAIPGELVNATTSDTQWPWMATVAAADGTWAITYNLPPGPSSSPPFTLTVSGSVSPASLIFDDVRWGDVWLCVGDSAMLLPVSAAIGGPAWLASAPVAKVFSGGSVRLFPVAAAAAASPQPDFGQGNCSWGSGGALSCNTWQNATLANAAGFSALCLQTALEVILAAGHPGNPVVGLVQVAAPDMPIESLLPPGANTSGCLPWAAAAAAPGVAPGALYNGMLAPFAAQTYRAIVIAQSGSDLAALNASAYRASPCASPAAGPYSCRASAAVSGLRAFTGIGDAPLLTPLQAWPPAGIASPAAVFEMQLEQLAILPAPGGLALDTAVAAVTNDLESTAVVPPGGGPPAPTNTLPVALRLALAGDYLAWWNYGRVGSGPIAVGATQNGGPTAAAISFAFAPDGNTTLPHLSLSPSAGGSTCPPGPSADIEVAASATGPWTAASAVTLDASNTTLSVSAAAPFAFVRYGAAGPVSCAIVDNSTGTALPSPPFVLAVTAAAAVMPSGPAASDTRKASTADPRPRLPRDLLSSTHLIQTDGSFDTEQYLRHGRERARAVAALQACGISAVDAFPTPPMGFNSWQAFRCNLSENDMLAIGRALVAAGLSRWYTFVNMDDCFARKRLANGSLTEDEKRFPSTMFHLGSELNALGLGFGVYTSQTSSTCVGRPGTYEMEDVDTARWCAWGATYAKVDNCGGSRYPALNTSWIKVRAGLDAHCSRPTILSVESCGSPAPGQCGGWIRDCGATMWRTTGDLQLYWQSVMENFDGNAKMAPIAGPGAYNDPDMLIVGHAGLTQDEAFSHYGAWAVSAAPLLLSFDLSSPLRLTPGTLAVVAAPEVIAVDQDAAVVQGVLASPSAPLGPECWARPLAAGGGNVTAALLINRGGSAGDVSCAWAAIAPGVLSNTSRAAVRDLWGRVDLGVFEGGFTAHGLQPHASMLVTVTPA